MNITLPKFGIFIVLLLLLASCAAPSSTQLPPTQPSPAQPSATQPPPTQPSLAYWPTGGWRTSTPEEQGMDSQVLAQMAGHIQQERLDLNSLLIVRNGYLVTELYVYPYSAGQVHDVWSVTKSVTSALIGIAIQRGEVQDVQVPVFSLLSGQGLANMDAQKKSITIENLLTQTSGLDCNDGSPTTGVGAMGASENWVDFVLSQPVVSPPGEKFNYCTTAIQVLSAILQKATGMSEREYANQYLFGPLGIGPIPEGRWPADPQGVSTGGYGLALTSQEMAKLGLLYLNIGQWDGQTVVPASWVTTSTTTHSDFGDKKEYGYLWWVDPQGTWYAALGHGGQHIFVFPARNLVVTLTASLPGTNDADLIPLQELITDYILPSIKSDQPLPVNPDGVSGLTAGLQALSEPAPVSPAALPAIAADISGKTYTFGDNPLGWSTMIFTFQDGADVAKVTVNGVRQLEVGLDNVYRRYDIDTKIFPEMLRGSWETPDTFVVEDLQIGKIIKVVFRVQFSGNTIHVSGEEIYSGSQFTFQGAIS